MNIPLLPQQNKGDNLGFGWGGLTRTIRYDGQPQPESKPAVNPSKLAEAIRYNETRGEKNPYSFKRSSGAGDYANGAYQVRDSELVTYGPRYLGQVVTPQQFLASPSMQDNYINAKASALAQRGLTAEQILAAHRGGASDLTPAALSALIAKHQGYVSEGMRYYSQPPSPPGPAPRSFQDLTSRLP